MSKNKPNILFFMADSLSPQFCGAYGDTAGSTPNIDRLAENGITFENAYCNSPLCAPSRASLITGRYVSEIGAYDNGTASLSEWPAMGHVMKAAGYETSIIGKMHIVGHDQMRGFDHRLALEADYSMGYDPVKEGKVALRWGSTNEGNPCSSDWMGPSYVKSEKWESYTFHFDNDELIHNEAVKYLSAMKPESKPFFSCVSYHHPHNPFYVPEKYREMFKDVKLPLPELPEGVDLVHGPMDKWLNALHYVPEFQKEMMKKENLQWLYQTYYQMTYDMDRRIGELLTILEKNGVLENTAIVFTSDHGDMLANRGMLQKRCFYEHSARVPLIFSFPGSWKQDVRIANPVSLIDLLPTFADFTNASVPGNLPGISLVDSLNSGMEPENRTVYSEYHGEGVQAPCFMARKDNLKYIYVHGYEERLYDLDEDPDEHVNLVADKRYAENVKKMKSNLLERFDPDAIAKAALQSQDNRNFISDCLS